MRVGDAIRRGVTRLDLAGVASPQHDAEALLGHVLGVPRFRLRLADALSEQQEARLEALLVRRCRREPLQHLTGRAAFRYVDVEVGPGVFVPRPETELLAGWAIDRAAGLERPVVADLCTGSGAMALAVATEVPASQVYAVELSESAHAYAGRNLAGSGVDLRLGDIADALADLDGRVDVVVANPPYIPLDAFESVSVEGRDYDPPQALWAGRDGLELIRQVEQTAARLLRPDGWVGCEHADVQGESASVVFAGRGRWSDVRDHLDLAGRPRFVTARRVCHDGSS
ncbi:MAG: peptide chain release factor N(5)-glutamine methyltransferase [Actinomycetota bacterium]|jgi:release factor glutamine methyltransferase|nr:peptide chain release factor N(5)-glutamine methyltransferase [Actinomycetota bacterium]MDQ3421948.1 peptide chain release factor N(5)-glutamine methyltransferase [Actinomycetota bacterium]